MTNDSGGNIGYFLSWCVGELFQTCYLSVWRYIHDSEKNVNRNCGLILGAEDNTLFNFLKFVVETYKFGRPALEIVWLSWGWNAKILMPKRNLS